MTKTTKKRPTIGYVRVELPIDVHKRLKALAEKDERPVIWYARKIISDYVEENQPAGVEA